MAHAPLEQHIPFKESEMDHLTTDQLLRIDMLIGRFSKLQDMIGAKIFPLILEYTQQQSSAYLPLRDILDKMEKLTIIPNTQWWIDLRELRNHVTHEYPDNPALMCQNLNRTIVAALELANYWKSLKAKIELLLPRSH